jgi:hypothetical protein
MFVPIAMKLWQAGQQQAAQDVAVAAEAGAAKKSKKVRQGSKQ